MHVIGGLQDWMLLPGEAESKCPQFPQFCRNGTRGVIKILTGASTQSGGNKLKRGTEAAVLSNYCVCNVLTSARLAALWTREMGSF